ncbi:hypothetical protein CHS0354_000676 [Potamilus streckersoni]|uniref:diaminopimelate epimerase n=1 Tax=Potamilus streckersoni TaxID=2493646 RepID=A0AAE0W854_9BIVA|nr:hypothetical protein CHS0354_000676 [Potamilus streckersoni]
MKINFVKCHGSENDFILINNLDASLNLSDTELAHWAKCLCNRTYSIGADGILLLLPSTTADARMRIFNADGSEPEMCGNGIRCLARLAIQQLKKNPIQIETKTSRIQVSQENDIAQNVFSFNARLQNVSFISDDFNLISPNKQPFINKPISLLSSDLRFTAVSFGNPHIVSLVNHIDKNLLEQLGKMANINGTIFPNGANVSFFRFISPQSIYVITYERGVGITYACGTAMSAASLLSCILNLNQFGTWIHVFNEGGMVKCLPNQSNESYSVDLLGNATFVYEGTLDYANGVVKEISKTKEFYDEIAAYERMKKSFRES